MDTSPLPDDLAHPRGERAHLIANVGVGAVLIVINLALIAFGLIAYTS